MKPSTKAPTPKQTIRSIARPQPPQIIKQARAQHNFHGRRI